MSRRNQFALLSVLLAVLAFLLYHHFSNAPVQVISLADEKFTPLPVENPSLRLDMLERIRKLEYRGGHRNIFSAILPPPPPPQGDAAKPGPAQPPPPPPLDIPAKFFGYDSRGGQRRAFFTNGEDVFIVGEGETLLNRFRLLRVGNTSAEVEEISSGRRATLVLEETGPPA